MTQQTKRGIIPPESDFKVSPNGFARFEYRGCPQVVFRVEGESVFFWSKAFKKEIEVPKSVVISQLQEAS